MLELWGMQSTLFIAITPGTTLARSGNTQYVLSIGQIELNYVLLLKWIAGNITVFDTKIMHFG